MADYVKMWEDLGMDLESHDTLCQVLPAASSAAACRCSSAPRRSSGRSR